MYLGACCGDCGRFGLGLNPIPSGAGVVSPDYGQLSAKAFDIVSNFAGLVPIAGPFVQGAMQFAGKLEDALNIGEGRSEADIIVHDSDSGQNLLMGRLDEITDAFLTGRNPSIEQLQQMYLAVYTMGEIFKDFVLSPRFTDRRASGQALNTVMPYIDGTCGYAVPLGRDAVPSIADCGLRWGDGTLGGPGSDGMMGALERAILRKGGRVPAPQITQNAGSSIATLNVPIPGMSATQAGWIPPRTALQVKPLSISSVGGSGAGLLALAAIPLLFFARR